MTAVRWIVALVILLTGASGGLGRLIAAGLATRSVPFIAATRDPSRLPDPLPGSVSQRTLDLDDPRTMAAAFDGVTTAILVSAGFAEPDTVIARHRAGLDAAARAGVRHVVYTSLSSAGDHLAYALPHRWTERYLAAGPLSWTVLRNGLYAELVAPDVARAAETGILAAPFGDGALAAVARADLADVAVQVAVDADADPREHSGRTYELVGTRPISGGDLAAAAGPDVKYRPTTLAALRADLTDAGLPPFAVAYVTSTYATVAAGFLADSHRGTGGDLASLLRTPPRDPIAVIRDSMVTT
ncbi:NAD(P)-dependent oxidoreductase [Virgisporangium aliadipatigenens]|uniref:NAD(P)-dependent oxidoreductase n=1 Tax=Virgisporangium aliadipatigenens TaxID=741659 RepID=A0A8J4DUQ7_9ACTN|nr:NAD(P)H-binding protein [Virgisporangium aliadipatigenens]GIJ50636.1 NAD(P)-dependent oxidoreductase [Virgisporangium aliadipatigenens]